MSEEVAKKWYVVRTAGGKEKKAKEYIEKEIDARGLGSSLSQVLIPTEKYFQVKNGKRVSAERIFYPGYVLVECKMSGEIQHIIRNIPYVAGFLGEGKDNIGGVWAAQRIPDDHVGVSCNIPRIGRLQRGNTEYFMCSDNIESVARRYGLWDGKGEFIFWKAFNASYANGKNFREREYFILNALAPSLELTMDMDELPFSIRPDQNVDVRKVIDLLRSTYEGTDLDMCQNVKMPVTRKDKNGKPYTDTITSPIANPWLTSAMQQTLNNIAPGTITFRRTVSVAWCSYSFVAQLRDWLPDCVGGVCWMSVDNPGQSPRVPIFCGNSELPQPYSICGHKDYNPDAILWKYRRANKLATVAWQRTKGSMNAELKRLEDNAFARLEVVEREAARYDRLGRTDDMRATLNNFTRDQYENTSYAWSQLEAKYWQMFGMGF